VISNYFDTWVSYLGQEVIVQLTNDSEPVLAMGTLIKLDDTGECVVKDEMGFNHYCWPALNIELKS
jgi:hypothetical protein